ncbi:hypothetical protein D9611_005863 [Ephemerocybe angulata]|uniref:MYND-type domain-containing protein n=1 Tax=Ephemerocybe angulata TaxID=980116 RepID=A0A8H5FL98_9AGAR|nr:hypothetical protein D9611_005863 [Tulosesus angulatus]
MQSNQSRFRVEALLNAAEGGSLPHLRRLAREWPTDISSGQRALIILLNIFKVQAGHLARMQAGIFDPEMHKTKELVLAAFLGSDGIFDFLQNTLSVTTNEEPQFAPLISIFQPHLPHFLAWLRFFVTNPQLGFPANPANGSQAATRLAILIRCGVHRTEDPEILASIVDFSLFIWMAMRKMQLERKFTHDEYTRYFSTRYSPLGLCFAQVTTRKTLFEKVNAATTKSLEGLCEHFVQGLSESLAPKDAPDLDITAFRSYVADATFLSTENSRFLQVVVKSGFPALALKLALEARRAQSNRLNIADIAHILFSPHILLVKGSHPLMVQIIDAGLLEIVIDDLISPPKEGGKIFDGWKFQKELNPLKALLFASYDRRIAKALNAAIESVPARILRIIASNTTTHEIWVAFIRDFEPYQSALKHIPVRTIPLCNSLKHCNDSMTESDQGRDAPKKCAKCQAAIYCSTKCQQEDWESLHRHDCTQSRVARIGQQLNGSWISHRTSMFNILHLEYVINSQLGPGAYGDDLVKRRVWAVDRTVHPMSVHSDTVENAAPYKRSGFELLTDARSQAMLRQVAEDESTILAVCISGLGRCGVATFAIFCAKKSSMSVGIDRPKLNFQLQSGFCKVLDVSDIGIAI